MPEKRRQMTPEEMTEFTRQAADRVAARFAREAGREMVENRRRQQAAAAATPSAAPLAAPAAR